MKIFLFNSLNVQIKRYFLFPERMNHFDKALPVGLLILAGSVKDLAECACRIIDLNHESMDIPFSDSNFLISLFKKIKAKYFSSLHPAEEFVIGFHTLCNSHHIALYLAKLIKNEYPGAKVVFGGPQASVCAKETMSFYPHVDFIITGEADFSFPLFIESIISNHNLQKVPGLIYRSQKSIQASDAIKTAPNDLDLTPLPDFDCYDYHVETLLIEIGRGCPYRCKFCHTSPFFSRKSRYKTFDRIIRELDLFKRKYGEIEKVNFIHDNFFADSERAIRFCELFERMATKDRFEWSCSSRIEYFEDPALLSKLKDSRCRNIYFGIESGSQKIQSSINKKLDINKVYELLPSLAKDFHVTTSFICEFPDESLADYEMTLRLIAYAKTCGCLIQIHPLTIYAGTEYFNLYKHSLFLNPDRENTEYDATLIVPTDYIIDSPEIFSVFYSFPLTDERVRGLSGLASFILNYYLYTFLSIFFHSPKPRSMTDLLLQLKYHWHKSEDKEEFLIYLKQYLDSIEDNNNSVLQQIFQFESFCLKALISNTPKEKSDSEFKVIHNTAEIKLRGMENVYLVPNGIFYFKNFKIPINKINTIFSEALKSHFIPDIHVLDTSEKFTIHMILDIKNNDFITKIYQIDSDAEEILLILMNEEKSIKNLIDELTRRFSHDIIIRWIFNFIDNEMVHYCIKK